MDKFTLEKACKLLNIPVHVSENIVNEEKGYYENYYLLEKKNGNWEFGNMNFERRPDPKKEDLRLFSNEGEAMRYFLLKVLRNSYRKILFSPDNPVYDMKTTEELANYFKQLGISEKYFSFSTPKNETILAEDVGNNELVISYVDSQAKKRKHTIPLPFWEGLLIMYRHTYLLYLLKRVEKELIKIDNNFKPFNDDEIEIYLNDR